MLRAVYRQQHSDSLRTAYADEHFSRQKAGIPSAGNFFPSFFSTGHHTFRPQTYFLPAPAGQHHTPPFIFPYQHPTTDNSQQRQDISQHPHAANIFSYRANLSLPPSSNLHFRQSLPTFTPPLSPATSHKKTEPSAQFFPLYISSTFPGLYNPQFSSCNTKPKCLRMPAKSGSLLLSSVITGLSFSSHSRLNSISLLPRPL